MAVFNPSNKQEVFGGLLRAAAFMLATILIFAGNFTVGFGKGMENFNALIIGNIMFFLGVALLGFSIYANYKGEHGEGFKVANIVFRVILLVIGVIMYSLMITS